MAQFAIGGPGDERARALLFADFVPMAAYFIAGETTSWTAGTGDYDFYVIRISNLWTVQWEYAYGGLKDDKAYAIARSGNHIVVGGEEKSFRLPAWPASNMWVLKIDQWGNIVWENSYGGVYAEAATAILDLLGQRLLLAGWTNSSASGTRVIWFLNVNAATGLVDLPVGWSKWYDMNHNNEETRSVLGVEGGGYLVAADIFKTGGGPGADFGDWWVLKLDANGDVLPGGHPDYCWGQPGDTGSEPTDEIVTEIIAMVLPTWGVRSSEPMIERVPDTQPFVWCPQWISRACPGAGRRGTWLRGG